MPTDQEQAALKAAREYNDHEKYCSPSCDYCERLASLILSQRQAAVEEYKATAQARIDDLQEQVRAQMEERGKGIARIAVLEKALRSLPLEDFDKDMEKMDAADFVDHAAEFVDAMQLARAALASGGPVQLSPTCAGCGKGIERHTPEGLCLDVDYAGERRWEDAPGDSIGQARHQFEHKWEAAKRRAAGEKETEHA